MNPTLTTHRRGHKIPLPATEKSGYDVLAIAALVAAIILARSSGQLRQASRGMLVGLLAVPLSPAVMWISVVAMPAR